MLNAREGWQGKKLFSSSGNGKPQGSQFKDGLGSAGMPNAESKCEGWLIARPSNQSFRLVSQSCTLISLFEVQRVYDSIQSIGECRRPGLQNQ